MQDETTTFNLALPYRQAVTPQQLAAGLIQVGDAELTVDYLQSALQIAFKDGFATGAERRACGRLQRKLDDAIDAKEATVQLLPDERDLLKAAATPDIFNRFSGNTARYTAVLEDAISSL